ncbi:MAG: hypothetical protein EOP21_00360, partial [Hyphomicrobiales bacterium]
MQRFYFHIRDDSWLFVEDTEGSLFPDLNAAIAEALVSARWILNDDIRVGKIKPDREFEITDDKGNILKKVVFKDA